MQRCMVPACQHDYTEWFGGTALCGSHAAEVRAKSGRLRQGAPSTPPRAPNRENPTPTTRTAPHTAA